MPAEETDGFRILTDRLWPRGISKESAHIDLWLKEIAPTTELRKWFGHEIARWETFKQRYREELSDNPSFRKLQEIAKNEETVTLLYAAKDESHNNAVVLAAMLSDSKQ